MGSADVTDGVVGEREALAGPDAGGVQFGGDLAVGVLRGEACDQRDRGGCCAGCVVDARWPLDRVLLGGAGAPADPDRNVATLGLAGDRDVGDQGAQQPLAVFLGCAVRRPQRWDVTRERFELLA